MRAIVYNKNSDNKTPCKRSGCGLIKSLLFLFFINDYHSFCCLLSFVLYFVFARSCLGNGSFFTLFEKTQKTNRLSIQSDGAGDFLYVYCSGIIFDSGLSAACPPGTALVRKSGKTPFLKNERKIIYVRKAMRFAAYLLLIAACAAASLAIGTRNGEQET